MHKKKTNRKGSIIPMDRKTKALCAFLDNSHSVYHAAANVGKALDQAGYTRLSEGDGWSLVPGGKYYVARGGSAVIAFRIPKDTPQGFLIAASHTDRPSFKLKLTPELAGTYTRVSTELYGGAILYSWLDRPLSVAGRVLVETETGAQVRLIDLDRDLLLIPSVAIHMNRQLNDGYKWNLTQDLTPLFGGKEDAGKLQALLEEAAGGRILSHDLYLYIRQKACVWGGSNQFISSQALDDLQCLYGCLQGFLKASTGRSIPVFCALDSEEVGSSSPQGAGSTFLEDVLFRVAEALGHGYPQLLSQSFLLSADNAHAVHPNRPELADPANAPVLGGGIVLKFNTNLRYCTDALGAGIFRAVCRKADVPVQSYYNRADIPGGSTLGHISIAHVSVPTADIGLPQLAMHSSFETAHIADAIFLQDAMAAFFGSTLTLSDSGFTLA